MKLNRTPVELAQDWGYTGSLQLLELIGRALMKDPHPLKPSVNEQTILAWKTSRRKTRMLEE